MLAFTGVVLANKLSSKESSPFLIRDLTLEKIKPDETEPAPIPKPPTRTEPPQVQTERLTQIVVVKDDEVIEPLPTQEDLTNAKIDVIKTAGAIDEDIVASHILDEGREIIENNQTKEPDIFTKVEIEAEFDANWEKFLLRTLNSQTPIDNNAPTGQYTVLIQFVVDIDGSVSAITPLTNLGYGLEQEAIRVLKKATKWKPAIQNGRPVKAYRQQPITFQVMEEL